MMKSKLFYGIDDGAGAGAPPPEEYVIMTDPETQAEIKVPRALEIFIGHVASANRKTGRRAVRDEAEKTAAELEAAREELEGLRGKVKGLKSGDQQVEALRGEYDKMIAERDKQITELTKAAERTRKNLDDLHIDHELNAALSAYDVYNRDQVIKLLKTEGAAARVEKIDLMTGKGKGEFDTVLNLEIKGDDGKPSRQALSAKDAVNKFFQSDENKHHLKNRLAPGAGSVGGIIPGDRTGRELSEKYEQAKKSGDLLAQIKIKQQIYENQRG